MKKIFGELNISWLKVIIAAVLIGVYTAVSVMLPQTINTSFSDLAVTFEVWILFGILIITNSKSAKESALKCFIFFLISQPLIYLVQDLVNGSVLFKTYYKYWFFWTIGCLPMGYIGYYLRKNKWWGLLILTTMLLLVGLSYNTYLYQTIFSFPRHLLSTIFCVASLIVYPLYVFNNKRLKIVGLIISGLIILASTIMIILNPPVYSTTIMVNEGRLNVTFDDTYKASLKDEKYGKAYIYYEKSIESYSVKADFRKAGKTELILESPDGEKMYFDINIKIDTFSIKQKDKS